MSGEEHKPEPSKHALLAAVFSLVAPVSIVFGFVILSALRPASGPPPPPRPLSASVLHYSCLGLIELVCLFGIVSACWAIPRRPENSRLISNSIQAIGFFGVLACLFVGFLGFLGIVFSEHITP